MDLKGKVAVVTGSSSGIGLDLCGQLTQKGCVVYGFSRRRTIVDNKDFTWLRTDVTRQEDIDRSFDTIFSRHDRVDLLVNNAGFGVFGDVETILPETWVRLIATNLTATFLCTRRVVPGMKAVQGGTIVNVSSIAGKKGFRGGSAYCASKFGVNGFSQAVMEELRDYGIRVCSVNPGLTDTEFYRGDGVDPEQLMKSQELAALIVSLIELPDAMLPDEIQVRPIKLD